jgi:excinuclease ABC subunit C
MEKVIKIEFTKEDIDFIKQVYDVEINFKAKKSKNASTLNELLKQGEENAKDYLKRNKLGQKLSLLDENNLFKAVVSLHEALQLKKLPRRIECYDISHLQGKYVYGSMVTFIDGRSEKKFYKLFKCPDGNNDFANHKEVLTRRLNRYLNNPEDKGWSLPDLIIVDGGKGQLNGNYEVLQSFNLSKEVEIISLTKREEEVFFPANIHNELLKSTKLKIGKEGGFLLADNALFLIQRLRDEAHRFAISNNQKARLRTVNKSQIENIKGVGEKTKLKLLQRFGSVKEVYNQVLNNPMLVIELIGENLFNKIKNSL